MISNKFFAKDNIWFNKTLRRLSALGAFSVIVSSMSIVIGICFGVKNDPEKIESMVIVAILIILLAIIILSKIIKNVKRTAELHKENFDKSLGAQIVVDRKGKIIVKNASFQKLISENNIHITDSLDSIKSDLLDDGEAKKINALIEEISIGNIANTSINLRGNKFINITTDWFDAGRDKFILLFQESFREIKLMCAVGSVEPDTFIDTFDLSPSGLVILDNDLRIVAANKLFKSMTAENIVEKQYFLDLVYVEKSEEAIRKIKEIKDVGSGYASINLFMKSSNNNHISGYVRAIGGGKLSLYFLNDADHKQLQIKLLQSQKLHAMGELAGGIAHDFNNLLTAMIGFCDLLLVRHSPADQSFTDIMQIKQNANRAANLVKQLLAFSRQQTLQPKVIDISEQLADLTILLQRLVGSDIEIDIIHGSKISYINADQGQLEQVIINLVINARDAISSKGEKGGRIIIKLDNRELKKPFHHDTEVVSPGKYVKIQVIDNGCGISDDAIGRIFDPFFSTKESGSGTGLGLSMVYGIIKQMGGFILVDTVKGKGTTFSIYLPEHVADGCVASANDNSIRAIKGLSDICHDDLSGSGTILFVEDEIAVRMFGARTMRDNGYNVVEAENGREALQIIDDMLANGESVDLIVTDVVMPHMDGPTMAEKLKEKLPDVDIIFISGYAESTFRDRVSNSNAESIHFLSKPFTLKDLAKKIKSVMETSKGKVNASSSAVVNFRG